MGKYAIIQTVLENRKRVVRNVSLRTTLLSLLFLFVALAIRQTFFDPGARAGTIERRNTGNDESTYWKVRR